MAKKGPTQRSRAPLQDFQGRGTYGAYGRGHTPAKRRPDCLRTRFALLPPPQKDPGAHSASADRLHASKTESLRMTRDGHSLGYHNHRTINISSINWSNNYLRSKHDNRIIHNYTNNFNNYTNNIFTNHISDRGDHYQAGTAIVQTRLIFNFSTPIPSETLVLSAITALLTSRLTLISDLIQVLNFTYENISNGSYAVIFTFSLSNISISEKPDLSNNTVTQVQSSINNALNTLLNEPGQDQFEPKSSIFISGSAVVQTRLEFNLFSPVPSESLVLSAIASLLSSRSTNLSDSINVVNFTYEEISNSSYAVIFTINISNISIPENPELRNDTYIQVEDIINNALNTLFNAPGAEPFVPKSSNISSSGKQIEGVMDYSFQYGDTNIPINFLTELQKLSGYYTSVSPSLTTTPLTLSGSAVVQARLVFDSFSPIPSGRLVLSAIASLLSSRSTNLSDSINVLNFTFEEISNSSYVVIFTISISNISIPENPELRNDTYIQVEDIINNALNTLFNAPGAEPFVPKSSNISSSGKQIEGVMDYSFKYGDTNIPNTFLTELQKLSGNYTSVPPSLTTTPLTLSGSAVVQARLVFDSFSPIPSGSLVLSAIASLLSSRSTNLSDSINVLNFTFEEISNSSYVVIFTISISNISIPENPELRNDTYIQVEDIINNALNTLFNAPGAEPFVPKSSNISSSGKQIEGVMDYSFQYGDTDIPNTFLTELQKLSGYYTSVPPSLTTTPLTLSGSAVVQARLVFDSFSPIPSGSLVLSAIASLLSSRSTNLSDSINVLNFTFEEMSNSSYVVIFTISISNISIPENPELRNDTYIQVEDIINNALNTLFNAPGAEPFVPKSSNISSSGKQIEGVMDYSFQYGDTNIPIKFLTELQKLSGYYTSVPPSLTTTPLTLSGSAVVQARLVFDSFSPIPSGSLVLSAIASLLSSRSTNLSDSINVLNFTFEEISNSSYAVIFTISISNISIPENPELKNDTYIQVEDIINNALNTLFNAPGAEPFVPKSSNISSSGKQIEGVMDYSFKYGDTDIPNTFLTELQKLSGNYTSVPPSLTTTPLTLSGSAVVQARLVFDSFSPIPSGSLVLSAIASLLSSRSTNLSDSINVLNFTFEEMSNSSYAVIFTISISNISIPENPELRNDTYIQVEDIINNALNTLFNAPGAEPFVPKSSNISSSGKQIEGVMDYSFQYGDTNIPINFLTELQKLSGYYTSVSPSLTTTPLTLSGSAVVQARLVFDSFSPIPSGSLVLSAIASLLSSRSTNLSDSINVLNFTFEEISNSSYAVIFTISISNISIPENPELKNDTYIQVEDIINNALNTLFNAPGAEPFVPKSSNISSSGKQIEGVMDYSFQYGDTNIPINFLTELQKLSAVVQARLVFDSFSPVPSESLVLSAIASLLGSRSTNFSDSINVLNFTYKDISNSSYAVIITISISNISIPENPELRNDTYIQVEDIINNALNTLLNAPGGDTFAPKSSNISSSGKQIEGVMDYSFKYGDTNIPISFLTEILKQSGYYTSIPQDLKATPIIRSGSAVVQTRLAFNLYSPVPNESLVLSAIKSLLSSRSTNLSDSLNVLNFTYQGISNNSYAVIFTIRISNITIPENPELRNDTYIQIEDMINNALNTLLNAPGAEPFVPESSNFTTSEKQIEGNIEYRFQNGDTNTPITFLSQLNMIYGSALVQASLLFNTSSVAPSENLVNAIAYLLSSRINKLSDSVNVLNFTVENISNTSFAVNFTININNIDMPENPDFRNNTYYQVERIISNVISKVLGDAVNSTLWPQKTDFMSISNQIVGEILYNIQGENITKLINLLNHSYANDVTQTTPVQVTSPPALSGSAVVQTRLAFNSFSPVPSESLVLSAIKSLLSSRSTNLSDLLNVLNFTYQGISNSSYAVIFTISINNISIPETPELSDDTYIQVEKFINNAINTLLNAPGAEPFVPDSSNFTTSEKLIKGNIEYSFQNGDARTPISFLSQLNMIYGSALVQARLVFNTSSVAPSDTLVINAITNLLNSRIKKLRESINVLNFTFENTSDTSFAVIFLINISDISMPGNPEFSNNTYYQVESIISNALSIILGDAVNSTLRPQETNFMSIANLIVGEILYNIQGENFQLYANGLTPSTTGQFTPLPPPVGTVLIYIHLLFKNLTNVPSEADVTKAANALLDSSIRLARDIETVKVYNPISIQNVTYQKLANNSYNIGFGFKISNVSISSNTDQLNETYNTIQNTINGLLNRILNSPNSKQFIFPRASYMSNSTTIVADSEYVFSEGDLSFVPSGFLAQILMVSGLSSPPSPTEATIAFNYELLQTTPHSGFPEWALAIIIPCIIAIVLIPCWIILCCLLCGCCAAVRRRYSRRRSYNVQYTTRNGIF
ncbi:uncharacterized protein Hap1MRO34_009933 [Clarias gariepinus]